MEWLIGRKSTYQTYHSNGIVRNPSSGPNSGGSSGICQHVEHPGLFWVRNNQGLGTTFKTGGFAVKPKFNGQGTHNLNCLRATTKILINCLRSKIETSLPPLQFESVPSRFGSIDRYSEVLYHHYQWILLHILPNKLILRFLPAFHSKRRRFPQSSRTCDSLVGCTR